MAYCEEKHRNTGLDQTYPAAQRDPMVLSDLLAGRCGLMLCTVPIWPVIDLGANPKALDGILLPFFKL